METKVLQISILMLALILRSMYSICHMKFCFPGRESFSYSLGRKKYDGRRRIPEGSADQCRIRLAKTCRGTGQIVGKYLGKNLPLVQKHFAIGST